MTPLPATPVPDFRSADFLRMHISDTMAFYHPRCIDSAGGFSTISATMAVSTMLLIAIWSVVRVSFSITRWLICNLAPQSIWMPFIMA